MQKVLCTGLWWPTVHKDSKEYYQKSDVFQIVGKPFKRDYMPLRPKFTLQVFDKWEIDFVGPNNLSARRSGARYIITTKKYLTRWEDATPVKDYSAMTISCFLFENIVTRFGCPRILMSDQGNHFINNTIEAMLGDFMIHHQKSTPYHHQTNGTMEVVLWAYRTTCKKLIGKTSFRLLYGQEEVVPLDYLIPSLCIATITNMIENGTSQEILAQLMELEEDRIMVGFHQEVQKEKDKPWHERHMKKKNVKEGHLVLLYDSKYLQNLGKLRMHWLGPYQIKYATDGGVVHMQDLTWKEVQGMVNGSRMKLYRDSQPTNS
jgi:hypothetical protein